MAELTPCPRCNVTPYAGDLFCPPRALFDLHDPGPGQAGVVTERDPADPRIDACAHASTLSMGTPLVVIPDRKWGATCVMVADGRVLGEGHLVGNAQAAVLGAVTDEVKRLCPVLEVRGEWLR